MKENYLKTIKSNISFNTVNNDKSEMKYKISLLLSFLTISLHAQTISTTRVRLGHELFNSPHFPFILSIFASSLLLISIFLYCFWPDMSKGFLGQYILLSIGTSLSLLHSNNYFIHIITLIVLISIYVFLFLVLLGVFYSPIIDALNKKQYLSYNGNQPHKYQTIIENIYKIIAFTVIAIMLLSSTVVILSIIIMKFKHISYQ